MHVSTVDTTIYQRMKGEPSSQVANLQYRCNINLAATTPNWAVYFSGFVFEAAMLLVVNGSPTYGRQQCAHLLFKTAVALGACYYFRVTIIQMLYSLSTNFLLKNKH